MIERILVIGAGTMGSGIAQAIAEGGRQVLLADAIPGAAEKARDRITGLLDKAVAKGKTTADVKEAVLGRISVLGDLGELVENAGGAAGAPAVDLVIEAITENATVKRELFIIVVSYEKTSRM